MVSHSYKRSEPYPRLRIESWCLSVPRPGGSGRGAPRTSPALACVDAGRASTPNHRAPRSLADVVFCATHAEVASIYSRMTPLAYFLTFRCYATWLPGDQRGCSDRHHRAHGAPRSPPSVPLHIVTARQLLGPPVTLDARARAVVEAAIRARCTHAAWTLYAVNVRTNHVHLVVGAVGPPERMMNQMKSWVTRRLREADAITEGSHPWSRHGSTRYLWTSEALGAACRYVVDGQGVPLEGCGRE